MVCIEMSYLYTGNEELHWIREDMTIKTDGRKFKSTSQNSIYRQALEKATLYLRWKRDCIC